jgi:hypothetical protein
MFAPQVAKILSPQRWLTVEQVASALYRAHAPIDAAIGSIAPRPASEAG